MLDETKKNKYIHDSFDWWYLSLRNFITHCRIIIMQSVKCGLLDCDTELVFLLLLIHTAHTQNAYESFSTNRRIDCVLTYSKHLNVMHLLLIDWWVCVRIWLLVINKKIIFNYRKKLCPLVPPSHIAVRAYAYLPAKYAFEPAKYFDEWICGVSHSIWYREIRMPLQYIRTHASY